MTLTCGQTFRRHYLLTVLSIMVLSMLPGLGLTQTLLAADMPPEERSVISSQLLQAVDELLATGHSQAQSDITQGMGALVRMAQSGHASDTITFSNLTSQSNLKVTAIPLPDAFVMSLLLLGILIVAYALRRIRLAM